MAFYPRLLGVERPRIPVDIYCCMVRDFKRVTGTVTRAQIIAAFDLSGAEASSHDTLMGSLVPWDRSQDLLFIAHRSETRDRLNITQNSLMQAIGVS